MIGSDRLELNERFIKVFNLLEERGDVVKNDRSGKGMGDFAERILGNRSYGHIIRAFLNTDDKRVIDYKHAKVVCREYGVNESYLLDGIGTPFGIDLPPVNHQPIETKTGNILLTTTEAFAGTAVDVGADKEKLRYFAFPGITGDGLVAFPISGNSMEPVIDDGDLVICRAINALSEIQDNKIYAIKSSGAVWVKYVQKIVDERGRVRRLKLISANHLEYDPFVEEVNEYTRLYKVIRRVSDI
ncbi:MAG: S24 family peptidase [Saprospiraceae bacterium]|nr:S24 family peptidase [Saprospiraceae bacterium]